MNNKAINVIGQYRIEELIGQGSMADVYRGSHIHMGRHVAIKLIHKHLLNKETILKRFAREAEVLSQLDHPNIVKIFDYVSKPDMAYLVMEYIPGGTLKKRLEESRINGRSIPIENVLEWMESICSAVEFAHKNGLIHRDLKPANILFRESGEPVLTDFGLAYLLDRPRLSNSNSITGTPTYLSPEQARGEVGDTRSDVYPLGVILYEILVGEAPFRGTAISVVMKHISEPPPSPRQLGRYLPQEIEEVIMRALAKKKNKRYQSAIALSKALRKAVESSQKPKRLKNGPLKQSTQQISSSKVLNLATSKSQGSPKASSRVKIPNHPRRIVRLAVRSNVRTIVSILITMILVAGIYYWAKDFSSKPPIPPSTQPRFQASTMVRITVQDGTSVSTYGDCPGKYWRGVLGVATDGQDGQIVKRKACEDEWWYLVAIPELADTVWQGIGWIDENSLQPR